MQSPEQLPSLRFYFLNYRQQMSETSQHHQTILWQELFKVNNIDVDKTFDIFIIDDIKSWKLRNRNRKQQYSSSGEILKFSFKWLISIELGRIRHASRLTEQSRRIYWSGVYDNKKMSNCWLPCITSKHGPTWQKLNNLRAICFLCWSRERISNLSDLRQNLNDAFYQSRWSVRFVFIV